MESLSIYVHIPFCAVKCPYCDFYSVAKSDDAITEYMSRLQDEIAYFAERHSARYEVPTIFFGGGTPSYVPSKHIAQTLENLRKYFRLRADAEITLEMNPGSCETAKLGDYRAMGINRISIGVQSFDNAELHFLGRVHNADEAHAAIRAVKAVGFDNFNTDFIFALPGQPLSRWKNTLQKAIAYEPPHLSAYNLTYEEGTVLAQQKKQGAVRPATDTMELRMTERTIEILSSAGLAHYEISNFSKPLKESRHNLAYWNGRDYLGFGAGAHSFLQGRRFSKKRSLRDYMATTSRDRVDILEDESLSPQRRFWELLVIGLRDLRGVNVTGLASRLGLAQDAVMHSKLEPWLQQGFLEWKNELLKLAHRGILYYDQIAAELI